MIQLIGTDQCPACMTVKMLLESNNIPYQWVDVSTRGNDYQGEIPVIIDDDEEYVGLPRVNYFIRHKLGLRGLY